jgi:L-alanine-DL-glutamate epimerase-like enolase superfamily enzyme
MVGLTVRCTPAQLARSLAELEVHVADLRVERRDVSLPDYPGGPRPSSIVQVYGRGAVGSGEHVAFSDAEQRAFGASIATWFQGDGARTQRCVGDAIGTELTRYGRAALEAALIDLALRQAGLSLADLTGVREAPLRFVVSLAADPRPLTAIARVRATGFSGDLKIDVDPSWDDATLAALAADSSIVIFDFKGKAELALGKRLAALSHHALFEDPPSGLEAFRESRLISRDASVPDAFEVLSARARGEAVNLKAPRMGGPLEVLRALENATAPPGDRALAYLGGMFEVGVGRQQARQLAALYCPNGPNDLAPNRSEGAATTREDSPVLVRFARAGFGDG